MKFETKIINRLLVLSVVLFLMLIISVGCLYKQDNQSFKGFRVVDIDKFNNIFILYDGNKKLLKTNSELVNVNVEGGYIYLEDYYETDGEIYAENIYIDGLKM